MFLDYSGDLPPSADIKHSTHQSSESRFWSRCYGYFRDRSQSGVNRWLHSAPVTVMPPMLARRRKCQSPKYQAVKSMARFLDCSMPGVAVSHRLVQLVATFSKRWQQHGCHSSSCALLETCYQQKSQSEAAAVGHILTLLVHSVSEPLKNKASSFDPERIQSFIRCGSVLTFGWMDACELSPRCN